MGRLSSGRRATARGAACLDADIDTTSDGLKSWYYHFSSITRQKLASGMGKYRFSSRRHRKGGCSQRGKLYGRSAASCEPDRLSTDVYEGLSLNLVS